jgi:hypothetical protein
MIGEPADALSIDGRRPRALATRSLEVQPRRVATPTMYCRRCDDVVEVVAPWPGWRTARLVWMVCVGALLLLSPVLGADFMCMIPSAFGFIFAGGTLHRLAAEKPVCRVCSLPLDGAKGLRTRVFPRKA